MNTVVYLIRHGQVDFPLDSQGRPLIYGTDVSLSNKGQQQIRDLGSSFRLEGIHFAGIYTSPIPRGFQSANILAQEVGNPPVVTVEGLRATNIPSWEGRPVNELETVGGDFYNYPGPGDELLAEVDQRIWEAFQELVENNRGKTIAIVTHGEESGILIHRLRNPESEEPHMDKQVPNGEAIRLVITPEHRLVESQTLIPHGILRRTERL